MGRQRYAARLLPLIAAVALLVGCATLSVEGSTSPGGGTGTTDRTTEPPPLPVDAEVSLAVEVVAEGFAHPWDVGFLPDGQILVTERGARLTLLSGPEPGATATEVVADLGDVRVQGEGGLMGLLVHPDFASTRAFTTCQNHEEGGRAVDIRLVTWTLSEDGTSATRERELLTGLPVASGGRHSGCRMAVDDTGALVVGTGDVASPHVPQDLTSLGGKVLRVGLDSGRGLPDNPFADSANENERRVLSFGHRNVQGMTIDPVSGAIITAEHGPAFDDEVNVIEAAGNYGWDPGRGGDSAAYDESVSMTDLERFPDAVPALWTSGPTTQAICAVEVLHGEQWGNLEGALVTTALRGAKLLILHRDASGDLTSVSVPPETDDEFGRLRAARLGPDGALYVTTSNGNNDKVLRITPTPS